MDAMFYRKMYMDLLAIYRVSFQVNYWQIRLSVYSCYLFYLDNLTFSFNIEYNDHFLHQDRTDHLMTHTNEYFSSLAWSVCTLASLILRMYAVCWKLLYGIRSSQFNKVFILLLIRVNQSTHLNTPYNITDRT